MSIRQDEEDTREWDRFWASGKVEDYLRYKNHSQGTRLEKDEIYCGSRNRKFTDERERFS